MTTIERQRKNIIARRAVYALILFALSVLQNTRGFFPEIFGVRALLLIPAVVCIAMHEREISGMFFGLFAGMLWDLSASGNNFNAIFLFALGFACGALISTVMRNNIVTASLLTAPALILYTAGYWLFAYVFKGCDMAVHMYLRYYLPCAVYSFAFLPFMFFGVRAIDRAFGEEQ